MINLSDFLKEIEQDSKKTDVTTPVAEVAAYPEFAFRRQNVIASSDVAPPGVDTADPRALIRGSKGYLIPDGPGGGSSTNTNGIQSNIPPKLRN